MTANAKGSRGHYSRINECGGEEAVGANIYEKQLDAGADRFFRGKQGGESLRNPLPLSLHWTDNGKAKGRAVFIMY